MVRQSIDLRTTLRERFGHDEFLPGQERVIDDLLRGRDVLAVLPTGGGKSLVYQLAAQLLPGVTIVVSPLLALMKDQVQSVEDYGLEAGVISSLQTGREADAEIRDVVRAETNLLYVTPERFEDDEFMSKMRNVDVCLLVVDEAHCISQWGHSFRPSYLLLGEAAEKLGRPTLLALTATASPFVRREIVDRLGMRDPDVIVRGIDRPNLFFEVVRAEDDRQERDVLGELLDGGDERFPEVTRRQLSGAMRGSGIVYVATTKAARETASWLRAWGIAADYYHGRRRRADRERVQDAFMRGDLRIIAATNAFGMGVDKPDVRFVIHRDVPATVEAYYQEAGRAGRDGQFARCAIIYRATDLGRAAFLSSTGALRHDDVEKARSALVSSRRMTVADLESRTGLPRGKVAVLLSALTQDGIAAFEGGRVELLAPDFDPDDVVRHDEEHRRTYERSRWEMMRGYAETTECRRSYILSYFGQETETSRCTACNNDLLGRSEREQEVAGATSAPFAVGDRVTHTSFGGGTVQRAAADAVTVLFDTVGYKTLAVERAVEQGMLTAEERP